MGYRNSHCDMLASRVFIWIQDMDEGMSVVKLFISCFWTLNRR